MKNPKQKITSFLHWTEKYTKTNMVYLVSGLSWSLIGQISASIIALSLGIIMAKYVPKDVYGTYKFIIATIAILSTFSLSGLNSAVFQSVANGYRSSVTFGFKENLKWSTGIFLGAFVIAIYYFLNGNITFAIGILLGGCASPFLVGYNLYLSLLTGVKDFRLATIYGEFWTNFIPAVSVALVAYFDPEPLLLIFAYFISNVTITAYAYYKSLQKYSDTEKKYDPALLNYSKHLSFMNILTGFAGNIDQILLFHYVGAIELAIYNFATAIPDQMKGPLKIFDTMVQTKFKDRSDREISFGMKNKIISILIVSFFAMLFYIIAAPLIFKFVFPNYTDAITYSQIYAISLLSFFGSPAGSYLSIKKKIKEQYIYSISISLLQILAFAVGVIYGGLMGLIIARVVVRFLGNVIIYPLYFMALNEKK